MGVEFIIEEIEETKEIIRNINTGINTILQGAQSYLLNTGQTEQRVTRGSIEELRKMRTAYLSELNDLEAAAGLSDRSVITVRPGF